jgi:phosphate transport system protein
MLKEVEKLKKAILSLSAEVEQDVAMAVLSVAERNSERAQEVIENDRHVDDTEIEVEEECLKILALHQPVAADLRFIIAVLKINNDLERVGDLAVNIAENTLSLSSYTETSPPFNFSKMADLVRDMLKKSLDALVNLDTDLAKHVCAADDSVDEINRQMYTKVKEKIAADPKKLDCLIHYLTISRHLERIADHATNIAEDVIYMIRGDIIRHGSGEEKET